MEKGVHSRSDIVKEINTLRSESSQTVMMTCVRDVPILLPLFLLGDMLDAFCSLFCRFRSRRYLEGELRRTKKKFDYVKVHGKYPS